MTEKLFGSQSEGRASRFRLRWPFITLVFVAISLLIFSFAVSAAPASLDDAIGRIAPADVPLPSRTESALSAALQDPQLGFSPKSSLIGVGETYCIDVTTTNANDLGAFEWDVTFDSSIISADGASLGPFLGSSGRDAIGLEDTRLADPAPGPVFDTGRIGYGAFSCPTADCFATPSGVPPAMPGPAGDGILASLQITGLAVGTSALNIENEIVLSTDATTQTTASPVNGSVQVTQFRPDDIHVIKQADATQTLHFYDAPLGMNVAARDLGSDTLADNIEFMIGGDFDGDGEDEIGVLGEVSGIKAFLVYAPPTVCGAAAVLEAFNLGTIPKAGIVAMAAADVDGNGKDEVVRLMDFGAFKAVLVNDAPTAANGPAPLVAFTIQKIPRGTVGLMTGLDYDGDGTDEIGIIKHFGPSRWFFIYTAPAVPKDETIQLLAFQHTLVGRPSDGWANPPVAMSGLDYNGDGTDEVGLIKEFGSGSQVLFIYQAPTGARTPAPLLAWSRDPTSGNNVAYLAGVKP